ncbi:MAG: hypothetical protein WCO06_06310 [Candidatus Roizmanbacteria bacterium]
MNERQGGYTPPAQPERPQPVNTPYAPVYSYFPMQKEIPTDVQHSYDCDDCGPGSGHCS